jgi:hypothetical protein
VGRTRTDDGPEIEFLAPDDTAFGWSGGSGVVTDDDWSGSEFADEPPRSRWTSLIAVMAVLGVLTAGIVAAAPWNGGEELTAPTTVPTTALPPTTAPRTPETSAPTDPPADSTPTWIGYGFENPPTGWLDERVDGPTAVGGVGAVWADADADQQRGRWLSVTSSSEPIEPFLGGGDDRREVLSDLRSARVADLSTGATWVATVHPGTDEDAWISVQAGGFDTDVLLDVVEAITVDAGTPAPIDDRILLPDLPSVAGMELRWNGEVENNPLDDALFGSIVAAHVYRTEFEVKGLITTSWDPGDLVGLLPFAATTVDPSRWTAVAAFEGTDLFVGRRTMADGEEWTVVSWTTGNGRVSALLDLPVAEAVKRATSGVVVLGGELAPVQPPPNWWLLDDPGSMLLRPEGSQFIQPGPPSASGFVLSTEGATRTTGAWLTATADPSPFEDGVTADAVLLRAGDRDVAVTETEEGNMTMMTIETMEVPVLAGDASFPGLDEIARGDVAFGNVDLVDQATYGAVHHVTRYQSIGSWRARAPSISVTSGTLDPELCGGGCERLVALASGSGSLRFVLDDGSIVVVEGDERAILTRAGLQLRRASPLRSDEQFGGLSTSDPLTAPTWLESIPLSTGGTDLDVQLTRDGLAKISVRSPLRTFTQLGPLLGQIDRMVHPMVVDGGTLVVLTTRDRRAVTAQVILPSGSGVQVGLRLDTLVVGAVAVGAIYVERPGPFTVEILDADGLVLSTFPFGGG